VNHAPPPVYSSLALFLDGGTRRLLRRDDERGFSFVFFVKEIIGRSTIHKAEKLCVVVLPARRFGAGLVPIGLVAKRVNIHLFQSARCYAPFLRNCRRWRPASPLEFSFSCLFFFFLSVVVHREKTQPRVACTRSRGGACVWGCINQNVALQNIP
jgi:hypothetical protein